MVKKYYTSTDSAIGVIVTKSNDIAVATGDGELLILDFEGDIQTENAIMYSGVFRSLTQLPYGSFLPMGKFEILKVNSTWNTSSPKGLWKHDLRT